MLPQTLIDFERKLTIEDILQHYKAGKAQSQSGTDCTRYFCPFARCQGDRVPHFVVEHNKVKTFVAHRNDAAHGGIAEVVRMEHWRCDRSHIDGYGVVSLVAAIKGLEVDPQRRSRDEWMQVLNELKSIGGWPVVETDDANRNGILLENRGQSQWRVTLADGFTPEAFYALGIDQLQGVDPEKVVRMMQQKFGLYQVEKYIMPQGYPNGGDKSYERRATALFPIFALCYDLESGLPLSRRPAANSRYVARIVMPNFVRIPGTDFDWRSDFWCVVGSDNHVAEYHDFRSANHLFGDVDAMTVMQTQDAKAVADAIGEEVKLQKEEMQEVDVLDRKGMPTGKTKMELQSIDLETDEIRLNKCVLVRTPLDGIAAYLHLNYPRIRMTNDEGDCMSRKYANSFWHVAWLRGADMELNTLESMLLRRVATDTFELFGNDRSEICQANNNAIRNNELRMCLLPTSMSEMSAVDGGAGRRYTPHSPIDFFRYYEPTDNEKARNMLIIGRDYGIKAIMLQKELNVSSKLEPFTRKPKAKHNPGEKPYEYQLNMAAAWRMMVNAGYCRSIPQGSRSLVGECHRVDGHFVYDLEPEDVMVAMQNMLLDYIKDNAHDDPVDAEMMSNQVLNSKAFAYTTHVTQLPILQMPSSDSYGPDIDYLFYRNGALEITPHGTVFRQYSDIDFLVYRSHIIPIDYHRPYNGVDPIQIGENPEYVRMEQDYEKARQSGTLTDDELTAMRQKIRDFGQLNRWQISITPTEAKIDPRIVVGRRVMEDTAHNEWLRYWPVLRILRCFANEDWAKEEDGKFTDLDRQTLNARMANIFYAIGCCLCRYRGIDQLIPYFLENAVDKEGKAQGGSGKTTLCKLMFPFVRHVCQVSGKNLDKSSDFGTNFTSYVHNHHNIIYIDDYENSDFKKLYTYANGDVTIRYMYKQEVTIPSSESPKICITSNYMVKSTDESSLGRIIFAGMSRYFHRSVEEMGKEGRGIDSIAPGFFIPDDIRKFPEEWANQIIHTFASCMRLYMMASARRCKITSPGSNLLERISRTELGDTFYDWAQNFFCRDYIYNVPIAINEIFAEYRDYMDPSKARFEMVSRTKFYENLQKYCATPGNGVSFMPIRPFLSASDFNRSSTTRPKNGTEKSYLRKGSAWLTRKFADPDGHLHYVRVLSKNAGKDPKTGGAVWFSRRGEEPKDELDMKRMIDEFMAAPDPAPIIDEDGNPVLSPAENWQLLNTDEEAKLIREAGGVRRIFATQSQPQSSSTQSASTTTTPGEAPPNDDLPF